MLKKEMTDLEIYKVCKKKPIYEETYRKGVVVNEKSEIIDRLLRDGTFAEIVKHANLGDGVESITIKIYFNSK